MRRRAKEQGEEAERSALDSAVSEAWDEVNGDDDDIPPVHLTTSPPVEGLPGSYVFNRYRVLGELAYGTTAQSRRIERQVIAIAQVLDAYELLDLLEPQQRENLMRLIVNVLKAGSLMSTPPNGDGDDGSLEGDEDEFTVADLGITEYKRVAERPRKEFAPWHRPRKQFVRKFQWVACLRDIYVGRDPEDRINYLGLPGTDLLDLRVFYDEICVPQNRMLRFLGFHQSIDSDSSEAVSLDIISLQQVKLRELVHEGPKVLTDDIKKIGSPNSIAYQEALRAAPRLMLSILTLLSALPGTRQVVWIRCIVR